MQKRVAFHTLGCKLNQAETSAIRSKVLERGFVEVAYGTEADLLIINSCSVTDTADAECRQVIRRGLRGAPDAAVAVTGCYAQLQPEQLASVEGVRGVFGSAYKMDIVKHAHDILSWDAPRVFVTDIQREPPSFVGARTSAVGERSRAFLKLQDGCSYSCTFCTIPKARGAARAMSFEQMEAEIQALALQGYHEVVLTGINLGEYSAYSTTEATSTSAEPYRFVDVVRRINQLAPPFRVRISSIEPNTITSELLDELRSSQTFVPHLHVPLQSGSAELLRLMKRRYNPSMYQHTVGMLCDAIPGVGLGIDVIVGFPGETDELFEESYRFIQDLPFTYLHVFTYSERQNTPAASFDGRVEPQVRKERTARLRALSAERQKQTIESNVGKVVSVISDSFDVETNTLKGISEHNIQVQFKGSQSLHRTPQRVMILGVSDTDSTCALGVLA